MKRGYIPTDNYRNMERSKNMDNHISQTTIYIGLNDSETGVQKYDSKKYISILKKTCRHYKLAFAVQTVSGGYFHEDGRYTEENTLMLKLMNVPEETVMELAKEFCVLFNQESVMVTTSPTTVVFVKDTL